MKATFTPGTTFAGYRVDAPVGRGGMGIVYRATDLSLGRPVALKLIAPELSENERFRARFLREPRLAASLDHPNVIPIYEAGEHEGQLYLAMRFVEGSDLKTVLEREGKLTPDRTVKVLGQVAGALDAAHRRALVHRDVKPANVLIDGEGHVYLTDFGITKQLGGDSTDTGRVVGTLDYLAPEQIRGEPVDGRTDVYALGCLLYECLAGAPPSGAPRRPRRCGPTCRRSRLRSRTMQRSTRCCARRSPRSGRTATRPVPSWSMQPAPRSAWPSHPSAARRAGAPAAGRADSCSRADVCWRLRWRLLPSPR